MSRGRKSVAICLAAAWAAFTVLLAVVTTASGAGKIEPADLGGRVQRLPLMPYLAGLDTDKTAINIERPDIPGPVKDIMTLEAKGPGALHRWVVLAVRNSAAESRSAVITIPHQGFAGSGIAWPRPPGSEVISVATAGPVALKPMTALGEDAFSLSLDPGQTSAVAFELAGPAVQSALLWQRDAYEAQKDYFAFFRGAMLGISLLLAAAMVALYGFRSRPVFLVASGFAITSVAFIALEAGHIPRLLGMLGIPGLGLAEARALIEGLMAVFLILCLVNLAELRRIMPVTGNLVLLLGGAALAIPLYGFSEPLLAAGLARLLFAATAAAGFAIIFMLWRRGEARVETALINWSVIVVWTFIAAVTVLSGGAAATLMPLLLAGLVAVLVIMGFSLAHFAFSQGYLSRHFFQEAGRRALALAGAQAYVWDWQPEDGELFVGEELERTLGQPTGMISEAGVEGFLEFMHPADRAGYLAAVAVAEQEGRGTISRQLRLRHEDGSYHWYELRGRAMSGHGRRAVRCIGTLTDITPAKLAEERLLHDAVHDFVTGLPNRALFTDRLDRAMAAAGSEAKEPGLHVLLIDIDRFKSVNDGLGHEVGDNLLNIIGRRLTTEIGPADSLARFAGDQFAILFAGQDSERSVESFMESIRKAIARPIKLESQEVFLTACIGAARHREAGRSAEQLIKDAALALYEAKRRGKDSAEIFRSSMRDDRAELVVLEQELRRAIERNEIEVHYQPIARLADMHLAGFEALVRWRHPALGLLAPESFIGLAEQTGMIKAIGLAVLNEAARQLGIWQRAYQPAHTIFVAVNISSAQLIDADLVEDIKTVLHREGVRHETLKIEVTESIVMHYPERAGVILERLKELGVGLACDDFGTGYSSLSSLRKLPFDTLKVDKSFLADAPDRRAGVILETIVSLAHALGLGIVAEGIENQEHVDRLGALDCDFGQGFFIGRPMTAKQVSEALAGLPYATAAGRTAITWLWERASRDPSPTLSDVEVTAARIHEARDRQVEAPPASSETPAPQAGAPEEKAAAEPIPVRESVAATVPPLGSAPMAPRLPKSAAAVPPQEEAIGSPKPGGAGRRRRRKKRRPAAPQI